jgi:CRISPR-associated endoribonuclease Cas6
MKINLKFELINPIGKSIPLSYRYELHQLVSKLLDGYILENKISDYSYSNIYFENHEIKNDLIVLSGKSKKMNFNFSSIDEEKIKFVLKNFEEKQFFQFYGIILKSNKYYVDSKNFNTEVVLRTETPVYLYYEDSNSKHVISPVVSKESKTINKKYLDLLIKNIKNKTKTSEDFEIEILEGSIRYKPQIFKDNQKFHSYSFDFKVNGGSVDLIRKIYYTGIGRNTGVGFGNIKIAS